VPIHINPLLSCTIENTEFWDKPCSIERWRNLIFSGCAKRQGDRFNIKNRQKTAT
jgi:hypothetical protein